PNRLKPPDVLWGIYSGEKRIGRAETRLWYFAEDDTYELETRVVKLQLPVLWIQLEIPEMISAYRLTRQGELRRVRFKLTMRLDGEPGEASLNGEVRDGLLYRSGTLNIPILGRKVEPKLEPVEAPRGQILNPLHPVPKVRGLHPGRRWRMPLLDPMEDA